LVNTLSYDLMIVDSDIVGFRAALEATREPPEIRITVFTKVQAMTSHSVCAERETAAVLRIDEGDT